MKKGWTKRVLRGSVIWVMGMVLTQGVSRADSEASSAAIFLKIGSGGRAAALGDTYCALVDDATAPYWNPAGLALVESIDLQTMYTIWLEDIRHEFIGYAYPLKERGVLGLNLIGLQIDNMEERIDDTPSPIGKFDARDWAFTCSYGFRATPEIYVGGGIKYVSEKIKNENANGLGMDVGMIYTPMVLKDITLGLSVTNISIVDVEFIKDGDPLPTEVRAGVGYRVPYMPFVLGVDLSYPRDNSPNIHIGAEYLVNQMLALRAGYKSGPQDVGSGFSAGIGLTYECWKMDYAYVPYGEDLGSTHRISLGVNLGGVKEEIYAPRNP